MWKLVVALLIGLTSSPAAERWTLGLRAEHQGMCDASAAIAVGTNFFLAASDEDNTLRLYEAGRSGPSLRTFDLGGFLGVSRAYPEVDLEGCAQVGSRVYWIGSHGQNKDGEPRPNRHRFFAVEIIGGEAPAVSVIPVGKPCLNLVDQLARDVRYAVFGLAVAARQAPKHALGLNIEGLAATSEGHLLIGFRNPVPGGKALLARLTNPAEVVEGRAARFGPPLLLDLDTLGIRDLVLFEDRYFIIAGPFAGGGPFRFYSWKGPGSEPRRLKTEAVGNLNPEVAILYPHLGSRSIQLLSDDGNRMLEGRPCKELKGRGRFRSVWLTSP